MSDNDNNIATLEKPLSTNPKLPNPSTDKPNIINRLATGETCTSISKDYDVTRERINQIKLEEKKAIEKAATKILKALPNIVETTTLDIQTNKELSKAAYITGCNLSKEQLTFKTITNKLSADILRMVGIFPSQSPSLFIQNIYQDNRHQTNITPEYQKFLDFNLQNTDDVDEIQAEWTPDDNNEQS